MLYKLIKFWTDKSQRINTILCTKYMRLLAKCWGFELGKNILFVGRAIIRKAPGSQVNIGENCVFRSSKSSNLIGVNRPCYISTIGNLNAKLEIGEGSGFTGTVIGCFKQITIGKNVMVGANSLITDSDWHTSDYRSGPAKPIIIEDGVWIGEGTTIMKGVKIGENALIGAKSVVIKDIPKNAVAAGNPCKVIRQLEK